MHVIHNFKTSKKWLYNQIRITNRDKSTTFDVWDETTGSGVRFVVFKFSAADLVWEEEWWWVSLDEE